LQIARSCRSPPTCTVEMSASDDTFVCGARSDRLPVVRPLLIDLDLDELATTIAVYWYPDAGTAEARQRHRRTYGCIIGMDSLTWISRQSRRLGQKTLLIPVRVLALAAAAAAAAGSVDASKLRGLEACHPGRAGKGQGTSSPLLAIYYVTKPAGLS
jgi:hypothetical protein